MLNRRLLRIKIYQGLYAMHNLQLRVEEQGKTLIANHFFVPYEERPEEYDADIDSARTLLTTSIFQDHLGLLSIPNEISTDLEPAVFEIVLRALRFYREELGRVNQNLFQNLVFETKNLSIEYARLLWIIKQLAVQVREEETRKAGKFIDNQPSQPFLLKFANNPIIAALENFPELEVSAARNNLNFEPSDGFFRHLYKENLKTDERYIAYTHLQEATLNDHLEFYRHLVKQLLYNYSPSLSYFEGNSITWEEDCEVLKNMAIRTLKSIAADTEATPTLVALTTDWEDDQLFMETLFFKTWELREGLNEELAAVSKNWDPGRLALSDELLLKMGMVELMHCASVPLKVTLNEFVDIAKLYSTPNSGTFINGLLDSLSTRLKEAGKIKKSGKGMMA